MLPIKQIAVSVVGREPQTPDELQAHIARTYFNLRMGIILAAVLLPVVVYIALAEITPLPSISDYYPNGNNFTRNWFVGTLWAVGMFLYLYKGYSVTENVVLNIAGVLAIVVAMVPCRCGDPSRHTSVHGFAAVTFFVCIAFVCIRCSRDTLSLIKNETERNRYRRLYRLIGIAMVTFPIVAVPLSFSPGLAGSITFFVEVLGIYTFAVYWAVKSREFTATEAETLALKGRARRIPNQGLVKTDNAVDALPRERAIV